MSQQIVTIGRLPATAAVEANAENASPAPANVSGTKRMRTAEEDTDPAVVREKATKLLQVRSQAKESSRHSKGCQHTTMAFDMFYFQYEALRKYASEPDADLNVVIACLDMMEEHATKASDDVHEAVADYNFKNAY